MSELPDREHSERRDFDFIQSLYPSTTAPKEGIPAAEWCRLGLWRAKNKIDMWWLGKSQRARVGMALGLVALAGVAGGVTAVETMDGERMNTHTSSPEITRRSRQLALLDANALRATGTCAVELSVMKSKLLANKRLPFTLYPAPHEYDKGIELASGAPCVPASKASYQVWVDGRPVAITGNSLVAPLYDVAYLCGGPNDPERKRLQAEINKTPPEAPLRSELQILANQVQAVC